MPPRLIALLALLTPAPGFADASDFDYIDIGYISQNNPDADGFGVMASYRFYGDFFAQASYSKISLDNNSPIDVDGSALMTGVGFVLGENETGSFLVKAAYVREDVEIAGLTVFDAESGYHIGLGIRLNTSYRSELSLDVAYRDLDIIDGILYQGQLVFDFTRPVSGVLMLGGTDLSDSTFFAAGIRINF